MIRETVKNDLQSGRKISGNLAIFLFEVLVIMPLMSRKKSPVSSVSCVTPKTHLMY